MICRRPTARWGRIELDAVTGIIDGTARLASRLLLVAISVVIAFVALEIAGRFVLDPVDYLLPDLVPDERLGHRVAPGSAHHDDWGFRNPAVPVSASMVAIGDSLTYGWNARARDAWPAALSRQIEADVYNLAMGDYGPGQYHALLEDYAVQLEPNRVLIGLYLGNDLVDAYKYVYVLDASPDLRREDPELVPDTARHRSPTDKLAEADAATQLRGWLARNSIMYRVATNSVVGGIARLLEARASVRGDSRYALLVDQDNGGVITLDPLKRGAALDLDDPRIAEGLRLTSVFLARTHATCAEHGIDCAVVFLPTKERVFAEVAARHPEIKHADALARLAADEALVQKHLAGELDALGMPYVDTLQALRTTMPYHVYSSNQDIHPNAAGYGVIADEIARVLRLE